MDRRNPVCKPLFTLEDVLSWEPDGDELCVARISKRPIKEKNNPKLLVCHDMRGGYLEDRLVQGCGKYESYRFYHWQYVDTFVYFSHYFVTIPPPAWTNAGHRHGTEVLGTLITEWDDGKARCDKFIETEEVYKQFADKLVKVCKYYGFDGWLVNIENVIEPEDKVSNMVGFVKYLTEQQHLHVPGSKVIWYDSVVSTGKLDWQNALNEHNHMFFDECDGIFLNYCWKEDHLKTSKENAVSKSRPFDVYVGIDVFGRGCLGDGGYNTREALEAVRKHDLSAAIFAQGWVYEKHGAENFTQNENKFWNLLADLCYNATYTTLPVSTTFCQGFGERFFDNGIPVGNPWWNMNVQQLQPLYNKVSITRNQPSESKTAIPTLPVGALSQSIGSPGSPWNQSSSPANPYSQTASSPRTPWNPVSSPSLTGNHSISAGSSPWNKSSNSGNQSILMESLFETEPAMSICTEDCYVGGSCLKLEADVVNNSFVTYNLFSLDVVLKHYSAVYVGVTYKILQDPDCDIFLELHLKHDDQSIVLVLVPFPDGDKPVPTYGRDTASMYVHPMNQSELPKILSQTGTQPGNTRWKTRWFPVYNLYLKFCRLTSVNVGLTTTDPQPKTCIALLGDLKILPAESVPDTYPNVTCTGVEADRSTSYPLIDVGKNKFNSTEEADKPETEEEIDWGVDDKGEPVKVSVKTLDEVRVSSHTLKEIRPGLAGGFCEVLYQLITSLDCFTVHWSCDHSDLIDHYRVYQIKLDSGVAKLLGQVTESHFKVTWFEIPDYEKDENTHHFKFVIRPVLTNGVAVPLDYNYCNLYHIASTKDSVTLIKDSCTETDADTVSDGEATDAKTEVVEECVKATDSVRNVIDVVALENNAKTPVNNSECKEDKNSKGDCQKENKGPVYEPISDNEQSSDSVPVKGKEKAPKGDKTIDAENIESLAQKLNISDE